MIGHCLIFSMGKPTAVIQRNLKVHGPLVFISLQCGASLTEFVDMRLMISILYFDIVMKHDEEFNAFTADHTVAIKGSIKAHGFPLVCSIVPLQIILCKQQLFLPVYQYSVHDHRNQYFVYICVANVCRPQGHFNFLSYYYDRIMSRLNHCFQFQTGFPG